MKQYPLHHEDARPMFATVDTEYLDQLHEGQRLLQSLCTSRENLELIAESLKKARTKHPHFCDCITHINSINVAEGMEIHSKEMCDEQVKRGIVSAEVILKEELAEARTEVVKGNNKKAKTEYADAIAVLIRTMEELDK